MATIERTKYKKEYYLQNKDKLAKYKKEYRLRNKDKIVEYYLQNKDKIAKYKKEYHLKNKEHISKRMKEYYLQNKDKIVEYQLKNKAKLLVHQKEYYLQNKAKLLVHQKEYYLQNKAKLLAYQKEYYSTPMGKAKHKLNNHTRRVRESNISHSFSASDWALKVAATGGVCPHCHINVGVDKMTLDHEPSISSAPVGFVYTISDVHPLCSSCNSSKGAKPLDTWCLINPASSEPYVVQLALSSFVLS